MSRPPTLDEQETTFTIEATDRNTVHVFTNDSVWIGRMEKLGIEAYDEDSYGKFYRVSLDDFGFGFTRKPQLSEERRQQLSERMAAVRAERSSNNDEIR